MDDLAERLGALEAETRAEIRNVRSEVAIELRAMRSELASAIRAVEHVDQCLEKRLKESKDDVSKMIANAIDAMKERVKFSDRVSWLVVSAIVGGVIVAALAWFLSSGESRRSIQLPTTHYQEKPQR